jgi:hypothetical protein
MVVVALSSVRVVVAKYPLSVIVVTKSGRPESTGVPVVDNWPISTVSCPARGVTGFVATGVVVVATSGVVVVSAISDGVEVAFSSPEGVVVASSFGTKIEERETAADESPETAVGTKRAPNTASEIPPPTSATNPIMARAFTAFAEI